MVSSKITVNKYYIDSKLSFIDIFTESNEEFQLVQKGFFYNNKPRNYTFSINGKIRDDVLQWAEKFDNEAFTRYIVRLKELVEDFEDVLEIAYQLLDRLAATNNFRSVYEDCLLPYLPMRHSSDIPISVINGKNMDFLKHAYELQEVYGGIDIFNSYILNMVEGDADTIDYLYKMALAVGEYKEAYKCLAICPPSQYMEAKVEYLYLQYKNE